MDYAHLSNKISCIYIYIRIIYFIYVYFFKKIIYYILHIIYYILHIIYCILYIIYLLYNIYFILHIIYYILYTIYYILYTIYYILYIIYYILYIIYYIIYIVCLDIYALNHLRILSWGHKIYGAPLVRTWWWSRSMSLSSKIRPSCWPSSGAHNSSGILISSCPCTLDAYLQIMWRIVVIYNDINNDM